MVANQNINIHRKLFFLGGEWWSSNDFFPHPVISLDIPLNRLFSHQKKWWWLNSRLKLLRNGPIFTTSPGLESQFQCQAPCKAPGCSSRAFAHPTGSWSYPWRNIPSITGSCGETNAINLPWLGDDLSIPIKMVMTCGRFIIGCATLIAIVISPKFEVGYPTNRHENQ